MTISEYACDDCGYRYEGCGGLGLLESGTGFQTVSCPECQALHDVPLGVNLRERPAAEEGRKRGAKPRMMLLEAALAAVTPACPVDASHGVRPWTDDEPRLTVPDAIVSVCPRCAGHLRLLRTVRLVD